MKKIFVGSLPADATEESVNALFAEFGTVRSINLVMDVFSGKCKGFGFIEMEGHEARAAIAGLDGKMLGERNLKVKFEEVRGKGKGGRRR
ncbi:MAG: RNA recognition motif domain-containing protein [Thiohalomonadales bacterium]